MISDEFLRTCLREHWGLGHARIKPHHGGMNSATWYVTDKSRRWVAKAVKSNTVPDFAGGLAAAALLDRPDLPSGPPERSRDGHLAVTVDNVLLALLARVPGDGITTDSPAAQRVIGTTLARAHAVLGDADLPPPTPSTGSIRRPIISTFSPGSAQPSPTRSPLSTTSTLRL
ncbi:hypothetical protein GCM10029992_55080 [Glycomyces albus]